MSGLTIGSNSLTPAFSADVNEYEVATTNATNKVTATADAEVAITLTNANGTTEIENGTAATWATGENTLTIKVDGTTTYTVTVTKS